MTKHEWASYGCVFMLFGWIPIALIGLLVASLFGWLDRPPWYVVCMIVGGIAVSGWVIIVFIRGLKQMKKRERRRAMKDLEREAVQVLEVSHPRVIEISLLNDNAPILAMDIGDNTILYLQGQWLIDPETYGADASSDDPEQGVFNGLPAPRSFPSSGFTLTRVPNTGHVLNIEVSGVYQPPGPELEALKPEYDFRDSELFSGCLDDIADVLQQAHRSAEAP